MEIFDNYSLEQGSSFDFGDKRLNERAKSCIKTLIKSQPNEGFPHIFKSQYDLKAFYRLMNNNKVTPEKFSKGYNLGIQKILDKKLKSNKENSIEFYQYQDTSYGSFLHRKNLDLGYIESGKDNGLVFHTSILTDSSFTPIGIADQQIILRNRKNYQKAKDRKKRAFEEKESSKWVKAMAWSVEFQKEKKVKIVHVGDRESDIKELFNYALENNLEVIVRAGHNRKIEQSDDEKLWDYLRSLEVQSVVTRQFLDKTGKRYESKCELKWVEILPNQFDDAIHALYLKQLDPPANIEASEWTILTTKKIETQEQSVKILIDGEHVRTFISA